MDDKKGAAEKKNPPRGVVRGKDLARAHEKVPRGHYKGEYSPPMGVVRGKDLARAHEKVPRGHYKGEYTPNTQGCSQGRGPGQGSRESAQGVTTRVSSPHPGV